MGLVIAGAIAGAIVGWILAALTSRGPKTPTEALRGGYSSGGVGCLGFVLWVGAGAILGAIVGGLLS